MKHLLVIFCVLLLAGQALQAQEPPVEWATTFTIDTFITEEQGSSPFLESLSDIQETPDKGYILTSSAVYYDIPPYSNTNIFKLNREGGSRYLGQAFEQYNRGLFWGPSSKILIGTNGDYIVGNTIGFNANSFYGLEKYNPFGDSLWSKKYGGNNLVVLIDIKTDSDGGYIMAGLADTIGGDVTNNHGGSDFWIVKTDSMGNLLWQRSYGGSENERDSMLFLISGGELDIHPIPGGGYFLAGITTSNDGDVSGNHGGKDFWILRLDNTGNITWQKTIGGAGEESGISSDITHDGGLIITGVSTSTDGDFSVNYGREFFVILKMDGSGTIQWLKTEINYTPGYFNPWYELESQRSQIQQTSDHGYAHLLYDKDTIVGYYYSKSDSSYGSYYFEKLNSFLVKRDSLGTTTWVKDLSPDALFQYQAITIQHELDSIINSIDSMAVFRDLGISYDSLVSYYTNRINYVYSAVFDTTFRLDGIEGGDGLYYTDLFALNQTSDGGYILGGSGYSGSSEFEIKNLVVKIAPEQFNTIHTYAFVDLNGNDILDAGEPPFPDYLVKTFHEADTFLYSRQYNDWSKLYVYDTGTYTTSLQIDVPYFTVTPPEQASHFSTFYQSDTLYFAVQPTVNITDLRLDMAPITPARQDRTDTYLLSFYNAGTQAADGALQLIKDPGLLFESATVSPDSQNGDTLTWNITGFLPFESRSWQVTFRVGMPPDVVVGDTLFSSALISPVAVENTPQDNASTVQQVVIGSFDPNDKDVNLKVVSTQQVNEGVYLSYIVRFQNTGNDTAFNIRIADTLSSHLVGETINILASSHPVHLLMHNDSTLEWFFDDIYLPDSNVNEAASHGYVIFSIKAKNDLEAGTTVLNNAAIYFDFNDPIITNTVSTLVADARLSAVVPEKTLPGNIVITPNPNNGMFNIALQGMPAGNYDLVIYDLKGTENYREKLQVISGEQSLDLDMKLTGGLYLLSVENSEGFLVRKIVIR